MLTVTTVNRCQYCASFHERLAELAGLPAEERRLLLTGVVEECPDEEIPALLYARQWAERDAAPDPEGRATLVAIYGAERARLIEVMLRLIRVGNLTGNTLDYFLFRLFGRSPLRWRGDRENHSNTLT